MPDRSGNKQAVIEAHARLAVERLIGPVELAEWLGVPVKTIYQWRYTDGGPRARKVGRHLRWRVVDVEKWIDEQ